MSVDQTTVYVWWGWPMVQDVMGGLLRPATREEIIRHGHGLRFGDVFRAWQSK